MNSLLALRDNIPQGKAISITLINTLISQGSACQADMESWKQSLAALEARLARSEESSHETRRELTTTRRELSNELSTTQQELSTTRRELSTTQQGLSTLQNNLAGVQSELAGAQSELTDLRPIVQEMHSRAVVGLIGRQFVTETNGRLTLETTYSCNSAAVKKIHTTNNVAHNSRFKPSLDALKNLRNEEVRGVRFHSHLTLQKSAVFDAVVQKALYCTLTQAEIYVQNPRGEVSL